IRPLLIQALLDAPMFITRWRWVIGVALALPRFRGGKKVAPQLARMGAEDLIAAVFPDQIACAENLPGERGIPAHPVVPPPVARPPRRRDGSRRSRAPARAHGIRRHSHRRPRPDRAFAAGARGALSAALRLSRRRAAGGTPNPSRDEPALALAGGRVRAWPTRPGGDRPRSRRSMARSRQRRRVA